MRSIILDMRERLEKLIWAGVFMNDATLARC